MQAVYINQNSKSASQLSNQLDKLMEQGLFRKAGKYQLL
jgi:hypothetical protein